MPKRRRVASTNRGNVGRTRSAQAANNNANQSNPIEDDTLTSPETQYSELPSTSAMASIEPPEVNVSLQFFEDIPSENEDHSVSIWQNNISPSVFAINNIDLCASGSRVKVKDVETETEQILCVERSTSPMVTLGRFINDENIEDSILCAICLDAYEISGNHRLISLKCGHLFGETCIRIWVKTNSTCPTCKEVINIIDIRHLYAKNVYLLDRSEEEKIRRELLNAELQVAALQMKLCEMRSLCDDKEKQMSNYRKLIRSLESKTKTTASVNTLDGRMAALIDRVSNSIEPFLNTPLDNDSNRADKIYKLYLNSTINFERDSSSRVMVYAKEKNSLFCSVKTDNQIFNSYGIRCIDLQTRRLVSLIHTSRNIIRDITINVDDRLLATTSMEPCSKIYDTSTMRPAVVIKNTSQNMCACAFDCMDDTNNIYFGGSNGHCFVYDIRSHATTLRHFETPDDTSPVIHIAVVAKNNDFPSGGVIVCKLQSLWFFENTTTPDTLIATKLPLRGPFLSLRFDNEKQNLLIHTRASAFAPSKILVAYLLKDNDEPMLNIKCTFSAGNATPIATRVAQINLPDNILSMGYLQGLKIVALYDNNKNDRIQTLPVSETIRDMCTIYKPNYITVAALSDKKLRTFKLDYTDIE